MTLLIDVGGREAAQGAAWHQHALFTEAAEAAEAAETARAVGPAEAVEAARVPSRTLDDVLSGAWEGLTVAAGSVACPVCDGEMEPRWSAGAGVVGGRCRDCGSSLA